MTNNKDDPQIKAQRVYDYYRREETKMLKAMKCKDWGNMGKIKAISETQKRRAFAGKILNI